MEFLAGIPLIGGALSVALPFLVLLGVVVFVHEYGHYIVGRWCGIQAETFSVGFGKPIYQWRDKRGTIWQIAILPLGGFVKFVGDMDPASARKNDDSLTPEQQKVAFHNASLISRALTVVAGPVANFILSIVVFTLVVLGSGQPSDEPVIGPVAPGYAEDLSLREGDRVLSIGGKPVESFGEVINALQQTKGAPTPARIERDGEALTVETVFRNEPRIAQVSPGTPASQSGMAPGDFILRVNGAPVPDFHTLRVIMAEMPLNTEMTVLVERDGEEMTFAFVPAIRARMHPETGERVEQATMGIAPVLVIGSPREGVGILTALGSGVTMTWGVIDTTITFLGDMIFSNADTSQLGGPIGIAQASAAQASAGLANYVTLIALLSTSIGLLNLFPIPILDGGHLMFYAAEAIRGRPLGERWMNAAMMVGLSLVLLLMGFATYNDLTRLLL